jgi:hypothetical protein
MAADPRGATGYRRLTARNGDANGNGNGNAYTRRRGGKSPTWGASPSPALSEKGMDTDTEDEEDH